MLFAIVGGGLAAAALFFAVMGLIRQTPDMRPPPLRIAGICALCALGVFALNGLWNLRAERKARSAARHPFSGAPGRNGAALVLVILVLGALAALALQLAEAGAGARRAARRELTAESLRAAAWMGFRRAAARLADDEDLSVDSSFDAWHAEERLAHASGVRVTIRTTDESRRLDLNSLAAGRAADPDASDRILESAFRTAGVPDARARIERLRAAGPPFLDWVHAREAAGLPAEWPDPPPETEPRAALSEWVGVFPHARELPRRVNLNTAPEPVLRALFGEEQAAALQAVLALREAGPIRSVPRLDRLFGPARAAAIRDRVGVGGDLFRVVSIAEQDGERVRLAAWLSRATDGECRVLRLGWLP